MRRLVATRHARSLPSRDMDTHGRFSDDENGSSTEQKAHGYVHKTFGQAPLDVES